MTAEPLTALQRPPRLLAGDTVALVATSGPIQPDRLAGGLALLESWGLRVRIGEHALDHDPTYPFLAGSDEARTTDLQRAWCDLDVAAVFVGRGGSGATRLLDRLDWPAMRAAGPKVLVGFSDVTALHEAVATHLGLASLFGPMPATANVWNDGADLTTAEHLRATLFEPEATQTVVQDATCVVPGQATGILVGGTLSLLAGAVGTSESRPAAGGIVVLEDIGEPAYRLDNRLTQLLRTGWFDGVRGVVLGSWMDCGDEATAVVAARLRELGVPMVSGVLVGHCVPMLTMPLGVEAELDADAGTLRLSGPALL
jgi:muramoyltetrapeptide carboxypeptidase